MDPVEYAENGTGSVLTAQAWNTSGFPMSSATWSGSPMSSATWSLGTGNDEGAFTISADGVLEFRMSPDYEQPVSNVDPSSDLASRNVYTVQVLVNDDGVSYSERFTITVTDVDEDGTVTLSTTAVRILRAAAGNGQVTLSWVAPLSDGGSALTGYEYRQSSDGGGTWSPDWGPVPGSDGSTTSHTPMGLTNGTEYTFEVRAVNAVGSGDSSRVKATPERPDTRGRVEWSTNQPRVGQELTPTLIDPDNPALAEARWRWRRQRWSRSDAGDSLSAPAPESRSGESKLGVIARTRQYRPRVSDLHQWLWVEVTYTDDYTDDSRRHRVSATASRAVGPGPPCAPANLKAKPGDGQVTLTWEAGCNNGGTIDRYQYRRPEAVKWVRVPGDGSARRQQVEGLTNGEAYTFEVRARNGQGWGPAAQATATPAAAERTVSFAAAAYQASEGGEAATVTVRLSPSASEALSIPITVNPPSGDFTVAGLTDGALSFSSGAERQTFTVTASEDADTVDETVTLGFGTPLPEGVSAGDPARATVTLVDDDPDEDDPDDDSEDPVGTPGEVRLSTASPQVGRELTATLVDVDGGLEAVAWQWQRRADASSGWVPIERSARNPIAATSHYTPVTADRGQQLRATVGYTDAHGPDKAAASGETAPVVTVPSVPRDFTAEAGNRQVALSWRAPVSDGGLSLTGYEYRRRAGSGSWSGWTGVGTNTTRTVTGLSNGTRYRFEVRARNAAGAGAAASASATPVQPNRGPYFTSGPTSVSFAENGSGPVGRYTARDPDGDAITWSRTGTEASAFQLEGTGTTRTLTFDTAPDYEAGRSYQVTVEVSDGSLQAERTVRVRVTDEPEPPEPPSGVRVSAPDNMGHERLEVSWTAPDNRGRPALSGNDVHYCKTNEVFFCDSYGIWSSLTVGGSATGTLLTGLSSHTGYTVRVRARNAEGTSGWSARATGRTRSAAAKALAGQLAVTGMKGLAALAAPNPFNPSTTLYFQLTETGRPPWSSTASPGRWSKP